MTALKPLQTWGERYSQSVNQSIKKYKFLNDYQPVISRKMTKFEIEQIFGGNPSYIKEINIREAKF